MAGMAMPTRWRPLVLPGFAGTSKLGMLVNLSAGIHGKNANHSCLAVDKEQDTPTANSRLADTGAFGQRSRQAGIEGIDGELLEPGTDALLR